MPEVREEIKKAMKSLETKFSPKELADIEAGLIKRFENGEPLWKAFGFPKAMLEEGYKVAYNKYNAGRYEEAKKLFSLLEYLDETDIRFRYSVAACYQMEKKYWEAIIKYTQCIALFEPSPLIYYHLADCYLQEKQDGLAAAMLAGCIRVIGNNPSYDPLKFRAQKMLESIEAQLEPKSPVKSETKAGQKSETKAGR